MKKFLLIIVCVVLLIVGGKKIIDSLSCHGVDESQYNYQSYCIKKGDTLWDIAKENAIYADDIKDYIYTIKKINKCGEKIKSGNYLIILVPKG